LFSSGDTSSRRYILELKITFIQVQAIRHHIAGEEDIRFAIAIHITQGNASAIVQVLIREDVERFIFLYGIAECNTRFILRG
jgi:hypothetical protein